MNAIEVSHKIVTDEEWLQARRALLAQEKAFTKQRDELSRLRRELPRSGRTIGSMAPREM